MRATTAYHVFVIDSNVETILPPTKWEREFSPGHHFSSLNRLCLLHNPYGFFRILQVIKVNSKGKKDEMKKKKESLNLRKKLSLDKNNCKNNPAFKDQESLAITNDYSFASCSAFLSGVSQLGLCNIVMGIQDTNRIHVMDANTQSTILMI